MTRPPGREPMAPRDEAEKTPQPPASGVGTGDLSRQMELGEFMEQLGLVMRLPRRRKPKTGEMPEAAAEQARPRRPASTGTRWGILTLAVILMLGGAALLRPSAPDDPLPAAAIGRWITDDPRYVGREFKLDSASITFYTGAETGDFTRHSIVSSSVRNENGKEVVSLDYVLADGTMTLAFIIEPGRVPTIRFMNQQDIAWKPGSVPGR